VAGIFALSNALKLIPTHCGQLDDSHLGDVNRLSFVRAAWSLGCRVVRRRLGGSPAGFYPSVNEGGRRCDRTRGRACAASRAIRLLRDRYHPSRATAAAGASRRDLTRFFSVAGVQCQYVLDALESSPPIVPDFRRFAAGVGIWREQAVTSPIASRRFDPMGYARSAYAASLARCGGGDPEAGGIAPGEWFRDVLAWLENTDRKVPPFSESGWVRDGSEPCAVGASTFVGCSPCSPDDETAALCDRVVGWKTRRTVARRENNCARIGAR